MERQASEKRCRLPEGPWRSCRGPNCDSNHYLVKIKVRDRIANVQKIPRRKIKRWDVEKLNKDIVQRDNYQKVLESNLKSGDRGGWSGQSTNEMGANEEGHKNGSRTDHRRNKI